MEFIDVSELKLLMAEQGVQILAPTATWISKGVSLGRGVVVYPNVVVTADREGAVSVGARSVLWPESLIVASDGGRVTIGEDCVLGPGGARLLANVKGAEIVLASEARVRNGAEVVGSSYLGVGAHVFGALSAQNVHLEDGRGGNSWPVANERGPVIKGTGVARGLRLERGQVVNGYQDLTTLPPEDQSVYHPEARRGSR